MDSRSEESNSMNDMMKAFTEGSFTLKMHPNGTISDIQGVEAIYENAVSKLSGLAPQMKAQLEGQMASQFGEESLKSNIEGALIQYPDEKIGKGSDM